MKGYEKDLEDLGEAKGPRGTYGLASRSSRYSHIGLGDTLETVLMDQVGDFALMECASCHIWLGNMRFPHARSAPSTLLLYSRSRKDGIGHI